MTEDKIKCCGIVVAAGKSARMGLSFSKQFILIRGIPAIIRTLFAFERAERIASVVVVCRNEDVQELKNLIRQHRVKKVIRIVPGGATRQQSVLAGVRAVPQDASYFVIHDGARALVTPGEIDSVVEDGIRFGASTLAVPVKDTIKIADSNGFVVSTPDRATLWAVQTPQVFRREIYLEAVRRAQEAGGDYTDDCQLVERAGIGVHLCMGGYDNLKLTTAGDVPLAEAILRRRGDTP